MVFAARFGQGLAIVGMDRQALPFGDEANDRVAWNRLAAVRQLHRRAVGTANLHRSRAHVAAALGSGIIGCARGAMRPRRPRHAGLKPPRHHSGQTLAQANVGKQVVARFGTDIAQQFVPARRIELDIVDAKRTQGLPEQTLAERGRLFKLHRLQIVANVRARLAGAHKAEPARIRLRAF